MTATSAPVEVHDTRGLWRVVLAVVAPIPMLAKGVFYLLSPVKGDAGFDDTVAAFSQHADLVEVLKWLDAIFVVGLVPATFAAVLVARRGAPRLTTAGAMVSLTGFLVGFGLLGGVQTPALVTVQHDLDPAVMGRLADSLEDDPLMVGSSILFLAGVVIGLGLLGGALRRSRAVPRWAAYAVLVGGATHPFVPTAPGQGVGLLVAAAGFVGVSRALLQMSDDEFDLPPRSSVPPAGVERRR